MKVSSFVLCLTSHRQRGHLETALPFTVPCDGRGVRGFYTVPTGNQTPDHRVAVQALCHPTPAPRSAADTRQKATVASTDVSRDHMFRFDVTLSIYLSQFDYVDMSCPVSVYCDGVGCHVLCL